VKVINESSTIVNNELLPQILKRIFLVCKEDPNFYLKNQIETVENNIYKLEKRVERNNMLLKEAEEISFSLKKRINNLEQKNIEIKTRLLEELGSEL